MAGRGKLEFYQRALLLAATLLVANPVVLYLATGCFAASLIITCLSLIFVQVSYSMFTSRLPATYAFNFLAILSVFVHAEVVFVFRFPEFIIEDLYTIEKGYYFNKPNLIKRLDDKEYVVDYLTNDQGFRIGYGQDPADQVTAADWLFLGDSYTQGAQVSFEGLYTTELYRHFPDRVIINAGISGFGIAHEFHYFDREGFKLSPEIVFLQISSFNDFMKVEPRGLSLTDYLMHYSAFLRFLLQDLKYENPAELPLGRWTEPFYPDKQSNRDFNIFFKNSSPAKKKDLEDFREYLIKLQQICRKRKARLIVFLLPTKEQVNIRFLNEVMTEFNIDPNDLDMLRPGRMMDELTRQLGIEFIDLLEAFRFHPQEVFFEFDEHLTPFGHRLVAREIKDYIQSGSLLPGSRLMSSEFIGDRYPSPSNDGKLMVYQSPRDGSMELFSADSALANPRRLTFNNVDESHPMISPNNESVIFTEGDAGAMQTQVSIMRLDGSSRRRITSGADTYGAIPAFSPDGTKVSYAEWQFDRARQRFTKPRILVQDLEGDEWLYLTEGQRESWRPIFSPDGQALAYIQKVEGQFDVFMHDFNTRQQRQITDTPYDEWDPRFSADGRYLVCAARQEGQFDLFMMNLKDHQEIRLTRTKGDEWDPVFSPDGSEIMFAGKFGFLKALYSLPVNLPRD